MNKLQEPRKKWLIYLDYVLVPTSIFFTIYNYIEQKFVVSIVFIMFTILSLHRLIKDTKINKPN